MRASGEQGSQRWAVYDGGKEGGRVVTWIVMPLGIRVAKSPRVTSVGLSRISE